MNTQTRNALEMAIEAFEANYVTQTSVEMDDLDEKAYNACKEALASNCDALESQEPTITEGKQLSNLKLKSQSEKPLPPPAPIHTCTYSRAMNQEYPRKCIHCGKVEAPKQEQEPVAWLNTKHGFEDNIVTNNIREQFGFHAHTIPLYTHPAPAQPLSEEEREKVIEEAYKNFKHYARHKVTQDINEKDGIEYWVARAIEKAHGIG